MENYKCSVIANPEGDAWEFAKRVYKYLLKRAQEDSEQDRKNFQERLEQRLQTEFSGSSVEEKKRFGLILYDCMFNGERSSFSLNPVDITNFSDKEFKPSIRNNIRRSNCFFIHDSNLEPSRWFTELKFINGALRNSSAHEIINIIPYHLFARQDRKDGPRTPISAQDVAEILDHDHTRVMTIDVHSEQIQGFYRIASFDNLPSFPSVIRYIRQNHPELDLHNSVVLGPDEGSIKRIRKYADAFGIGVAIVDKERKISGDLGENLGILGDVKGKDVLEIDDMITSGNTAINGAIAARNHKAKSIWMYATHGVFTEGYEKIAKIFDRVLVGDTLRQRKEFFQYPHFKVISFSDLIGEAAYRTHRGRSISELFKYVNNQ